MWILHLLQVSLLESSVIPLEAEEAKRQREASPRIGMMTLKVDSMKKFKYYSDFICATDKQLEIGKKNSKVNSKLTKNLEIKLKIYSYFKLENKLEIFRVFLSMVVSGMKSILERLELA